MSKPDVEVKINIADILKHVTKATDETCKILATEIAEKAQASTAFRDSSQERRAWLHRRYGWDIKGLRKNIRVRKSRFSGYLVTTAPNGHLIEYGHKAEDGSFVAPRPFLRPARDAVMTEANIAAAGQKAFAKEGF